MPNPSLRTPPQADRIAFLRFVFWVIAVVLGAAECWSVRHEIISDGIPYLEIASAYAHGEWWNALNAYWSPLFSWLITAVILAFRPSPYWQVATVHLTIFLAYLASLVAFEYLLRELLLSQKETESQGMLPRSTIYVAGYCCMLFAGLSMVGTWFCSPDMVALCITLLLTGTILRIQRTGGSNKLYVSFGVMCALGYFARTAFVVPVLISIGVILLLLWRQHRPFVIPGVIIVGTMVCLAAPFVAGITAKQGRFTIGDAGTLNYSWELDGAHRWIHWQGEPYDIGTPKHPTKLAVSSPKTFTFAKPVVGSYPPWRDPSYWYAGVQPKFKLKQQLALLLVNISVLGNLFVRSPIILPVFVLVVLTGIGKWLGRMVNLWAILIPVLVSIGLYALVYVERRYLAGNFLILWMTFLVAVRVKTGWTKRWGSVFILVCSLLFTLFYVGNRLRGSVTEAVTDLVHRKEQYANVNFLLAEHLEALGLCPGDKVAYIGPGMNADWARLAQVKIVAEIPLMYARHASLLYNKHVDDPAQIDGFFALDPARREQVLQVMRDAGAKIVVTDGYFSKKYVSGWPRVLARDQRGLPDVPPDVYSQLNSRYLWLLRPDASCKSNLLTSTNLNPGL